MKPGLPDPRQAGGGKRKTGLYAAWSIAALLVLLALAAPAAFVDAGKTSGGGRPTTVTFKYHAFGGANPATLSWDEQRDGQTFDKQSVADQGTFTVTTAGATGIDMLIGSVNIDVHVSCSSPIHIGDIYNDDIEKNSGYISPDFPSIVGYNGPTAIEIVNMNPVNACGNTATPPPSSTPTPTPTPTPSTTPTPTPPPPLNCPDGTNKLVISGTNSGQYSSGVFFVDVFYRNTGHVVDFASATRGVKRVVVLDRSGLNTFNFSPAIRSGTNFQGPGAHTIQKVALCWVPTTPTPTPTPTPTRTPTPTPCNCPTPTPTPPPCDCDGGGTPGQTLVQDFYGRTTSGTWKNADIGGPYTHSGTSSSFNVNNGSGAMTVPNAGSSRGALLNNVSAKNVDIKFKVQVNKLAAGGNYYVYAVARHNGNNEYRPRLIYKPGGAIQVHASVVVNGSELSLGTPVTVGNLAQCNCEWVWVRAQVYGSNPTTIRVKAWKVGASEPGWQFVKTSSHATCQGGGSVGLRTYLSSAVTNAPVTFRFDNYTVKSL